jgi:hypothetical protein
LIRLNQIWDVSANEWISHSALSSEFRETLFQTNPLKNRKESWIYSRLKHVVRKLQLHSFTMSYEPTLQEMVHHVRYSDTYELEIRLGLVTERCFLSGYDHQYKHVVNRLITRLKRNCKLLPQWTMKDQYMFMRAEYEDGIRQTCMPGNGTSNYETKRNLQNVDLVCLSHPLDLRCSLSVETPVHPMSSLYTQAPKSVRVIQRATFHEEFCEKGHILCQFQYDVSKVTPKAKDKFKCTQSPCRYHCEIELTNTLHPIADKKEEERQDKCIARALLFRGGSFLGTHTMDGIKLPLPIYIVP